MNPCLEIDPERLLIVVGPQFTVAVLRELAAFEGCSWEAPTFGYSRIVEEGVGILLEAEGYRTEAERSKQQMLYRNAYELDPIFAQRKVSENLKKHGRYEEWLEKLFRREFPPLASRRSRPSSESLAHLLDLQRVGALLVYTHCDDALSRVAETQPVLLENTQHAEEWSKGASGFLHIHGVYTEPTTVRLDCNLYENSAHPMYRSKTALFEKALEERYTVILGFDSPSVDPLQGKFLEGFIANHAKHHVFAVGETSVPHCLSVILPSPEATVRSVLSATGDDSLSLWKQIDLPVEQPDGNRVLGLLICEKQGAMEISKMMFQAPGANFALVNSTLYRNHHVHTVSVRVQSNQFHEFWRWIFEVQKTTLLSRGLLGVVLCSGTVVWLKGNPLTGSPPTTPRHSTASAEVAMDVSSLTSTSEGTVRSILSSSIGQTAKPAATSSSMKPPSPFAGTQDCSPVSKPRKVPRYVVQVRSPVSPSSGSPPASRLPSNKKLGTLDDSRVLMTSNGTPISKSVFYRRGSLPPMKHLPTVPEHDSPVSQLAGSLQNGGSSSGDTPSYVALRQALLIDTYRRRQSIQPDPKTLKNLLQAKLVISDPERKDLVSQRRQSDPGQYLKQRDFERRKELFVDENATWFKSYSKVIDKKIMKWEQKRQARRLQMLQKQLAVGQNGGVHFRLLNPLSNAPQPLIDPHYPQPKASIPISTTNGAPQSQFIQPTSYLPNIAPFVFPQTYYPPATAANVSSTSTVYSPFLTPYSFVNPYSTLLTSPQPTTFLLPQGNLTAAPSQQNMIYFVPSSTMGVAATPTVTATGTPVSNVPVTSPPISSSIAPQLAKLIGPSPVRTSAQPTPVTATTLTPSHHQRHRRNEPPPLISADSRKRYSSLPEQLSSLLQPGLTENSEDADMVPSPLKKHRGSDPIVYYTPSTNPPQVSAPSPKSRSSSVLKHHLQTRVPNNHQSVKLNGDSDERRVEKIARTPFVSQNGTETNIQGSQLQLWQFLLELLLISANSHLIEWTDNFEFQINKPHEISHLWGKLTNNPGMTYEALERGLQYYYRHGVMSQVLGKRLTFQYCGSVKNYVEMRRSQAISEIVVVE